MDTIGMIGAGRMGIALIDHLVKADYRILVYDIDSGKKTEVETRGGQWSSDIESIGNESEIVLICVGLDSEVEQLLVEEGSLLSTLAPDTIIAILSTISPYTVQALSKRISASKNIHVIDAPMCRGGEAADKGELLSFVGGTAEIVKRISPVLQAFSSDIVHTGDVGTAQVSKAVNNLILWACLVADHEGLALAKRFNVDVVALRKALLTSSSSNEALANWGKQTMAWAKDDMSIVGVMADALDISLPQAGVTREVCRTLKPRRYDLDAYGK